MADRTVVLGGVWAEDAPNVPGGGVPPAEGVTYANSALASATIEAGWPFASIVHSENFNEIMRRMTTLLGMLETYGLLPWCASTEYPVGAQCMGSDGVARRALILNSNKNPTLFPSVWLPVSTDPVPTGTVLYHASQAPPVGYFECNGQAVNRLTYAALFSMIGTTFGAGDGASTFNLPDLRGEFIRVWDHGRGVDSSRTFGTAQGFAQQNITGTFGLDDRAAAVATGAFAAGAGADVGSEGTGSGSAMTFDASRQVTTATEVRPRNIALTAIIKY